MKIRIAALLSIGLMSCAPIQARDIRGIGFKTADAIRYDKTDMRNG
jgi:hypothetical protein